MRYLIGVVFMLSLSGCAALFGAKQKTFDLRTQPEGADVYLNGNRLGTTPVQVKLSNLANHTFVFRKEGYKEATCALTRGTDGGWVVLDILAGLVPVIVDAATNSWSQTKGKSCVQGLEPVPGIPQRAPAPTAADAARVQHAPQPALAPAPPQPKEAEPKTTIPPGTQYVGDVSSRYAYQVTCTTKIAEIPQLDRYFYMSAQAAQTDGFIIVGC